MCNSKPRNCKHMSAGTAEADAAACSMANAAAECAAVPTQMTTAVAARAVAVLDMIEEHRVAGTAISARRTAAISAVIDDVAATAAEGAPRAGRRRRRMASASGYKQVGRRVPQGEPHHGVVVRALHRATGRAVAVKSLGGRRGGRGGGHVCDVLREACLTAACAGHRSLVGFRTVARRSGTRAYSIVTEYVGPSLRAVVADRGDQPFTEAEVRRVMRQLLAGAEAMHGRGIVHRDIKPDNILVGAGAVKIGNFGVAKSTAEKNDPCSSVAGTMAYMAPEVLAKSAAAGHQGGAPAADAWSLGCVMAELLLGGNKPLFAGRDEENQLFRIFDVLGVPSMRVWDALGTTAHGDKVRAWRERQLRARHQGRLRELFPEAALSKDGFQVLKGLLARDPAKRLTAAGALRCPWFTENHDDAPASGLAAAVAWSCSLAVSLVGRVLGLVRPEALLH